MVNIVALSILTALIIFHCLVLLTYALWLYARLGTSMAWILSAAMLRDIKVVLKTV